MPAKPITADILSAAFPNLRDFDFINAGSYKTVYRVTRADCAQEVLKIILDQAEDTYARIGALGLTLRERSNKEHIQLLREELAAFRELAEI